MSDPIQTRPAIQAPTPFKVQRWRPAPILTDQNLDLAIKTAFDNTSNLESTSPQSPVALHGSQISSGALSVTGLLKAVATGLGTVSNVVAGIDNGSAATNMWVTATPNTVTPGTFDIYVWKPTASGDTTPTKATSPVTVRWLAWGTA